MEEVTQCLVTMVVAMGGLDCRMRGVPEPLQVSPRIRALLESSDRLAVLMMLRIGGQPHTEVEEKSALAAYDQARARWREVERSMPSKRAMKGPRFGQCNVSGSTGTVTVAGVICASLVYGAGNTMRWEVPREDGSAASGSAMTEGDALVAVMDELHLAGVWRDRTGGWALYRPDEAVVAIVDRAGSEFMWRVAYPGEANGRESQQDYAFHAVEQAVVKLFGDKL